MQRDIRISLIRVIAMFSIVACHVVQEYSSIKFLGQFFNVGVFVFLFMSAFLYGKKEIGNAKDWFVKRAIRLCVPIYIFVFIMFVINAFFDPSFKAVKYLAFIVGLQGFVPPIEGTEHLWFITALIICYLITPLLCMLKKTVSSMSKTQRICMLVMLMGLQAIVSYMLGALAGRYVCYIVLYMLGYYLSYLSDAKLSAKGIWYLTIIMIVGLCTRVVARKYIDDSMLYTNMVVLYSQSIFGIWIFLSLYRLKSVSSKFYGVINYLDTISFEVYIVHSVFITGRYSLLHISKVTILNLLLVGVLVFISSNALHKLSNYVLTLKKRIPMSTQKI